MYWHVLDLETTGLKHNEDEIAEIAIVTCNNTEIIDIYHRFYSVNKINPAAFDVNGLNFDMLKGWGHFREIANLQFLLRYLKYPIFGHNIKNFDAKFLESNNCYNPNWMFCDTRDYCRESNIKLADNKLQTWLKHFNLNYSGTAHSALPDTFNLARLIVLNNWQFKAVR